MTNPSRVAFTLFGRDIYWYGILMAAGILLAIWLADKEEKRKGLPKDTILDACLYMIPLGVVFARLYYVIFEWQYYSQHPADIFRIWQGGLAFYGSLLGGLLGIWLYSRHKKIRMLRIMDCVAPGLALAQALGRWGNFFNQEAYGLPVNNGSLIWFPMTVRIDGVHYFNGEICTNPYHLATFFYESMWCLLIAAVLWANRKKFKHDGDAFLTYALLYGFERMLVEGLRGDSLYLIQPGGLIAEGIRVSQLGAFLGVVCVAAFFLIRRSKEKKLGRLIWPAPEAVVEAEQAPADADMAAEMEAEASAEAEAEMDAEEAEEAPELPAEEPGGEAEENGAE